MAAVAVLRHALNPAALQAARLRAGLTQDDAGAAIGRTGAIVCRYESGAVDPPASIMVRLAELYRVDIGTLIATGETGR
jgi:transcriptional regulator with XRE-family HTH domain